MALRQLFRYFFQCIGQLRVHFIFCWRAYPDRWEGMGINKRFSEKITGVQFFEIHNQMLISDLNENPSKNRRFRHFANRINYGRTHERVNRVKHTDTSFLLLFIP